MNVIKSHTFTLTYTCCQCMFNKNFTCLLKMGGKNGKWHYLVIYLWCKVFNVHSVTAD